MNAISLTEIPELKKLYQGKVRDMYKINEFFLLLVTTDRISAFDFVMQTPIPEKGKILNRLSSYWFENFVEGNFQHHFLTSTIDDYKHYIPLDIVKKHKSLLDGRSMIVRRTKRIDIECVVRGYLYGSAYSEYTKTGQVCGITLPEGLKIADKLDEPIFTPAIKNDTGHDENISFERLCEEIGTGLATALKDQSLKLYNILSNQAYKKRIIPVDTKFEWGLSLDFHKPLKRITTKEGKQTLILIDEVFTPESSRFWPASAYSPGTKQESRDKQLLREYLLSLCEKGLWDKNSTPPALPDTLVSELTNTYKKIFRDLTM